ncbi:MAG: hypothetical protein ACYTG5_11545, partial [Planctomycetota bacterium]
MLNLALSTLVLILPQTQGKPSKGAADPKPRVIGVDEDGWPIFAGQQDPKKNKNSGRSDFETSPRPLLEKPIAERGGAVFEESSDAPGIGDPMRLGSPLREVFARLGYPSDMRELRGVRADCRFSLLGETGAEVGRRDWEHLADLESPDRDLLRMFADKKTYGRDGAAVFAMLDRVPMSSFRDEAKDELQLLGLLLRFPWCFADAERFRVEERQSLTIAGVPMVRIPIRGTRPSDDESLNGLVDRFEILCAEDSMEPKELHYTLAASGRPRRIRLGDYQRVGGVRIPLRREFLNAAGSPTLILEILGFESGLDLSATDFRPV